MPKRINGAALSRACSSVMTRSRPDRDAQCEDANEMEPYSVWGPPQVIAREARGGQPPNHAHLRQRNALRAGHDVLKDVVPRARTLEVRQGIRPGLGGGKES